MLDEMTGLPELPEGYYWKIEKIEIGRTMLGVQWSTLPALQIEIWGPDGREITRQMVDRVSNRDSEHAALLRKHGFETINDGYLNVKFESIYDWVRVVPATVENILMMAEPMVGSLGKRIEYKRKEREKRENLDRFVGIYPPNNLKGNV